MVNVFKKFIRASSYLRHPVGVTCFDCGFLAMDNDEVTLSDRILLYCEGSAGCTPVEEICCFRSLWVEYALGQVSPDSGGIFQEIKRQRRHCPGFFRYKSSWSPKEHQDLLLKSAEKKERIWGYVISAAIGVISTLLVQYIAKQLRI
jgi:hypothetical protein